LILLLARTGHQGGEALHEFQRRHDDMGGAVLERALQLQHDIAGAITLEPFVGDRRAGDIAISGDAQRDLTSRITLTVPDSTANLR